MRLVSTSRWGIGRVTRTVHATGIGELTGAGFQGIGAATTEFGFTGIIGPAEDRIVATNHTVWPAESGIEPAI